ncbi:Glycosyltransferase involved in cell wall bisynthesis [Evansella caseinilytica]|uniref:Glycosyltransferase involved in cell wall bisynthesis n=1 Tax=Evansella caseinilytica TaxID=1503961 RepID=A0A1H3RW31_9BACI|nr:glycosyltransferase family 1 protein [Evansella caseinilytica]SDZ29850.1 Glycosyltransferase involved in cell wall bisynthesis [Evansella caseinilytica]
MKIALFTDTFVPQVNGVARTLSRLVRYFDSHNIQYKIFAPEYVDDKDVYSEHIHYFTSFRFSPYPECRLAIPNVVKIRQQLQLFSPDLIHIATPFNIGLCGLHYSLKYHVPFVASYHTNFDQYLHHYGLSFMSNWIWQYHHWFYRHCKRIYAPSRPTKRHLEEKGFQDVEIWSRGVDCDLFSPGKNTASFREKYNLRKKYLFLYTGRVAPEKDIHVFSQLVERLPSPIKEQTQWVVVGDGPALPALKAKHGDSVCFTGYLDGDELAAVYAAADLLIFPSSTETFGNVVLESLASGTPAVVADKGGVIDIVEDQKTGFICKEKDAASFLKAIEEYVSASGAAKNSLQKNCRRYALQHSWNSIFSNLIADYEKVIHETANNNHKSA